MASTLDEYRDYVTELYCNQSYSEAEILGALLNYNVQTNAADLRRHIELWQLDPAPQRADPLQLAESNDHSHDRHQASQSNTTNENGSLQRYLQYPESHEQRAIRLRHLTSNDDADDHIDLQEPLRRHRRHRSSATHGKHGKKDRKH